MSNELKLCVLFRASKKTGKIDTTITALGHGLLSAWGLRNCTKSKMVLICERDTGKVLYVMHGNESNFPDVQSYRNNPELGYCDEYGIPKDFIKSIIDERFD